LKNKGLKTYTSLARIGFPKSYSGKIMLVVFAGTQLPLVALVICLALRGSPGGLGTHLGVLAALLIATLLGFVATLLALRALLAPVRLASSSLEAYLDQRRKPELPICFSDEVGKLMADVQHAVDNLDTTIRSLQGLSGTDHLTGLPNRRGGEEHLAADLARAKRGGAILTVAVGDVNNFKAINDTHGHQAGDVCIRHVARVIRRNIREGDWLARWGGDEFIMSLWDASVFATPEAVLGRISRGLKESPVRLPLGEELLLSISVGASRYAGEDDIRELLAKADAAMYEAKRDGRAWVLAS
jgi:diguanylate cyclase (GGDEF)-like protein